MSDVQGFPPSASDYILSEDMFIPDVAKATDPKDRARRQRSVRRVVKAFDRAKRGMSLWSVSMLWNYLRTTDWVCGERDVSKHPEGRLLLEQDGSSRWPMDWYGRLFVVQATCHTTDQLERIHREHASHWGCAYHEDRPFYPDLYRDNSRNSRRPGSSEYSVALSTWTQDSAYSTEPNRGRSPPRPRAQSPTLADYDIIDPLHLEEAMPSSAVSQPTRPDRPSPEDSPAQVDLVMSPLLKQPTQPVHTGPKISPRPSHAGPASSCSVLNQLADLVPTRDRSTSHEDVNQLLTKSPSPYMPASCADKEPTQPASTNPEVPRPAQPGLITPAELGDRVINHDPFKPFLSTFPDLSIPATLHTNQLTRPARNGPEISRPVQADPTIPPPMSRTGVPARTISEATSRPGHFNPVLHPYGFPPTGGMIGPNGHLHTAIPNMPPPASHPVDRPVHVRGPPSMVTNPHGLRPRSPRHGDLPLFCSGRNTGPVGSVLDVQSCIIQATQAAQQAIELSQRSLHHVRRLEAFSNTMSDYVQQSALHARRSRNYMDGSAAVSKRIKEEIRGSMANNEAAVNTANRALGLVERLRNAFQLSHENEAM
ncbi:hypothetical protein NW754_005585 [Fusarium falciforme]|uniref:Uncharacterized protein n=1 Tax=Fusarium falciforme TaxID=195108 RepID=A0A9W8UYA4_9HYPO|nr:hypothetical protein NW754_005585 [Fusarium falciforme]KAJ4185254.1 hypothetical protein NW755_008698 [Fusarium falciforme]KAJ4207109.1 hypothetical protein NW767_002359 [Fusarium falciforme]KAJ4251166.1 hypothetical protein NW757_006711 [Fusarium falciforme]